MKNSATAPFLLPCQKQDMWMGGSLLREGLLAFDNFFQREAIPLSRGLKMK